MLGVGAALQQITGIDVISARNATAWYHYPLMLIALIIPGTNAAGKVLKRELRESLA